MAVGPGVNSQGLWLDVTVQGSVFWVKSIIQYSINLEPGTFEPLNAYDYAMIMKSL